MKKTFPIGTLLFLAVVFVSFGDKFLPASIGKYSTATRVGIEDAMVGAFPQFNSKAAKAQNSTLDKVNQMEGAK
jgi:hypothetical protein